MITTPNSATSDPTATTPGFTLNREMRIPVRELQALGYKVTLEATA